MKRRLGQCGCGSRVFRRRASAGNPSKLGRARSLRLEPLEARQLLAASPIPTEAWVAPLQAEAAEGYTFEVVAKAEPDEWYNGIGQPYVPLGEQQPGDEGQPKVNQDYLWGMTQSGDYIWFGSVGNALLQAAGAIGGAGGEAYENSVRVAEYGESQYPGVSEELRVILGDWRPPEIHRYNMATGVYENMTPDDWRLEKTLGLRSAGATDEVVLLAGPDLHYIGMNVFAFNAQTGEYLGSEYIIRYSNIRRWENVDGQLYTSVLRTFSTTGEGAVLRWTGSLSDPFSFQEVGHLDGEGAYILEHEGRLYVATWPLGYGSLMGILGFRSEAKAGIWMSPRLGDTGLTRTDAGRWQKVWTIDQYEPDPVIAKSYGGGAMESFDGYLYWGTMQVPGTGMVTFLEAYPDYDPDDEDLFSRTTREAVVFRAKGFDDPDGGTVELLYGDDSIWTYTLPDPEGTDPTGTWRQVPNNTGEPVFGPEGFNNAGNYYVWSAAVQDERLYIGTFDAGTIVLGDTYVAFGGDVEAMAQYLGAKYGWGNDWIWMGGDLFAFFPDTSDGQPVEPIPVSKTGTGNPLNHGVRNMEATEYGLFLGSANSGNLMTHPEDAPLDAGGWELIHVGFDAGITVTPSSGLVTTEQGGVDTFAVVLNSRPTAPVTIGLSTSDPSEGRLSTTSLTFRPFNWHTPKMVTVSGVDDDQVDGDIAYTIITAPAVSRDRRYHRMDATDVPVTNLDDGEPPEIAIRANGLKITDYGDRYAMAEAIRIEAVGPLPVGAALSQGLAATLTQAQLNALRGRSASPGWGSSCIAAPPNTAARWGRSDSSGWGSSCTAAPPNIAATSTQAQLAPLVDEAIRRLTASSATPTAAQADLLTAILHDFGHSLGRRDPAADDEPDGFGSHPEARFRTVLA